MIQIKFFRYVSFIEALSYIALLAYAMPLKYIWDDDSAVKFFGRAHGGLVILFCIALFFAMRKANWSLKTTMQLGLSSLIPIVPFFLDPWLKGEEERVVSDTKKSKN